MTIDHVYIRRDLTFNHRQEPKARREQPASRVFTPSVPLPQAAVNWGGPDMTHEQACSRDVAKSQPVERSSELEASNSSDSSGATDQGTSAGQSGSGPTNQEN